MAMGVTISVMFMVVVVLMVVVMMMGFRGTTAYGTHGFSQPPFLSPATLHRI